MEGNERQARVAHALRGHPCMEAMDGVRQALQEVSLRVGEKAARSAGRSAKI